MIASSPAFWAAAALSVAPSALAIVNYPIEFAEPKNILERTYNNDTIDAQQSIIKWADMLDTSGPWSESPAYCSPLTPPQPSRTRTFLLRPATSTTTCPGSLSELRRHRVVVAEVRVSHSHMGHGYLPEEEKEVWGIRAHRRTPNGRSTARPESTRG